MSKVRVIALKGDRIRLEFPDGVVYEISSDDSRALSKAMFFARVESRFEKEPKFSRETEWKMR